MDRAFMAYMGGAFMTHGWGSYSKVSNCFWGDMLKKVFTGLQGVPFPVIA